MSKIIFNAKVVEALCGVYLSHLYDELRPTPPFHRHCWELYCDTQVESAAVAAPRKHAKTSSLTINFAIAAALFRWQQFILLIGASERLSVLNLLNIKQELDSNQDLKDHFGIKGFVKDTADDIIVSCEDGYQFRIMAVTPGQKFRGLLWNGKRPGLCLGDDIEDDELASNRDRRDDLETWILNAVKPSLREGGLIRIHGTILNDDSVLSRLIKNRSWKSIVFRAHESFDDFGNILWPEKFSESRLRKIRQEYIDAGKPEGYSQEYLNNPRDNSKAYLKREQFLAMDPDDYDTYKYVGCGVDFATSPKPGANRTSFSIGGKDSAGVIHFIDQRVDRLDALGIIEQFFAIHAAWRPQLWFVEGGGIWNLIKPMLFAEMSRRDIYLNITALIPSKNKAARGASYQARMQARGCRFDKQASWYASFEDENLSFTGYGEAKLDDQFDSAALLVRGLDEITVDDEDTDGLDEEDSAFMAEQMRQGVSRVTGY